jgi:hypothetical protein
MLYIVAAQGGEPARLAKNVSSFQGFAWSAGSRELLFLSPDETGAARLRSAPLDGGPAALIPEFSETVNQYARACAVMEERLLYTIPGIEAPALAAFRLTPALGAGRYTKALGTAPLVISGCAASADGTVLADAADARSNAWVLPIDAESGAVRGSLASISELAHVEYTAEFTPDGESFLLGAAGATSVLQNYRTGKRTELGRANTLSSDGLFALQTISRSDSAAPEIVRVLNLATGQAWGSIQGGAAPWDLSRGGQWVLRASIDVHRTIVAWDTGTAEHRPIYSHPSANLYLASFSPDGRWAVFTSEEGGQTPHMWAAPFRGLQDVPLKEWVDLGEGDYPRWSPAGGRIYFTEAHDGYGCIFTRAVDPATKQPLGRATEVQHLHGRLTPLGLQPGTFRISVARDKIAFRLGEQLHQLLQWK